MRLQLDSISTGGAGNVGQANAASGTGTDSTRVGADNSGAQDSIQISGPSSALNRLAADRAAQIQQLTSAVQSGAYQVSSSLVGSALVEHALS